MYMDLKIYKIFREKLKDLKIPIAIVKLWLAQVGVFKVELRFKNTRIIKNSKYSKINII
jgi:hypothetical protein